MINNFLSCAWIYILESFHHHRPWFENLLKISMNLKDSTNFQIYFFTPISPLKYSFLSIWTKKKKRKKISTRSLFKSGFQKRTRFHPQSEGRKFNEFPSVLYKIYGGWRKEREREKEILHLSSSFINRRRKKECSRKEEEETFRRTKKKNPRNVILFIIDSNTL